MIISRADVLWNYAATFLKIGSSILLLPLILKMMPSEKVGMWTIFITISSFAGLLDFGFNPSFTRNVTYIFSGIKTLKKTGVNTIENNIFEIDFGLLKGIISTMRWFYLRIAIIQFILLSTIGTYYIASLMQGFQGDQREVYIAWGLLCGINTYNIFTLYYDSLLQGKGLIKKSKQIIIIGQTVYLLIAGILILNGNDLIAIVTAQVSSVIIIRWLSYRTFFNTEIKQTLHNAIARSQKEILKAIFPNALKVGLTGFSGFLVQKSSIIIGALYLTLDEIASYGITIQLIALIASLSGIYTATYQPKIVQLRVTSSNLAIKQLYLKGQFIVFLTYIVGGLGLLVLGGWTMQFIGSKTQLMPIGLTILALILSLEQTNLIIAGGILLTKNEVPFFKAALVSGMAVVLGLLLIFQFFTQGLIVMLLIPLIVDISYQTWKWPLEVIKELQITIKDVLPVIKNIRKG